MLSGVCPRQAGGLRSSGGAAGNLLGCFDALALAVVLAVICFGLPGGGEYSSTVRHWGSVSVLSNETALELD